MASSSDYPYPPPLLLERVFGVGIEGWSDPHKAYDVIGGQTKDAIVKFLPDGWSFDGKRILDFGCGAGRTLRHFLPEAERAEFWGTDIDAASIRWLQENLCPPLHAWQSAEAPPMGLEHGSFDLAYAVSVFTHLTDQSLPWLLELHRLLKPGGFLIASYMGRWNSELFAGEPWDESRIGMNALHHDAAWDIGGPIVLMSDWWVRAHWGRAFEILHIEPQVHSMSWAVMRKRDVELTTDDLERPEDDPREYLAARHHVRQLRRAFFMERGAFERERDGQRQQNDAALSELRAQYEASLSWRLTRPIRSATNLARSWRSRRPG